MRKTTGPRRRGVMGRWSIFRGKVKDKKHRKQGLLTSVGLHYFEAGRKALRTIYRDIMGREPVTVSDADVIEFNARGEHETRRYLRALRRREAREQAFEG